MAQLSPVQIQTTASRARKVLFTALRLPLSADVIGCNFVGFYVMLYFFILFILFFV